MNPKPNFYGTQEPLTVARPGPRSQTLQWPKLYIDKRQETFKQGGLGNRLLSTLAFRLAAAVQGVPPELSRLKRGTWQLLKRW